MCAAVVTAAEDGKPSLLPRALPALSAGARQRLLAEARDGRRVREDVPVQRHQLCLGGVR